MEQALEKKLLERGYELIAELGSGAIATTYHCRSSKKKNDVAIKVLSLKQVKDWKIIELFEREAKVLSGLKHIHIPQYIENFSIDTSENLYFCLVQKLAVGKSLDHLYTDGWRPNEKELRKIARQILEALVYLHSLNPPVIHRDIKPQNIVYQPDTQHTFLVDSGAVQDVYRNTFSHGLTFVGTMGFMSPEQYTGQVSFASDLYSLAATIVYLITGLNPADLPQKRMQIDWQRLATIDISPQFAQWLNTLLHPIPEKRAPSTTYALALLLGTPVEKISPRTIVHPPEIILESAPPKLDNMQLSTKKGDKELLLTISVIPSKNYFVPAPECFDFIFNTSAVLATIMAVITLYVYRFLSTDMVILYALACLVISFLVFMIAMSIVSNLFFFDFSSQQPLDIGKIIFSSTKIIAHIRCQRKYLGQTIFDADWQDFVLYLSDISAVFPIQLGKKSDRYGLRVYYGNKVTDLFANPTGLPKELAEWLAEEINQYLGFASR